MTVPPRNMGSVSDTKPLFLGGADELGNLEMFDVDVYWHLMAKLISKVRGQ